MRFEGGLKTSDLLKFNIIQLTGLYYSHWTIQVMCVGIILEESKKQNFKIQAVMIVL